MVGLLEKFLDHRKDLPTPEEDDLSKKTEHLTEKEREERAKVAEEEKKAKDAEEEAKAKEEEAARNALSEEEKVNWDQRKIIEKLHKESADKLTLKKLSKKEQRELFRCIRYNFLSHEDLIELSEREPFASIAQDYLVEGLSYRLDKFSIALKKGQRIMSEPRSNYQAPEQQNQQ